MKKLFLQTLEGYPVLQAMFYSECIPPPFSQVNPALHHRPPGSATQSVKRIMRAPMGEERPFLDAIHCIQDQRLTDGEKIPGMRPRYYGMACELLEAMQQAGTEGFNRRYNALSEANPMLEEFRAAFFDTSTPQQSAEGDTRVLLLSEVKPEEIRWLWQQRLALGKLATLDGDPGLGKTSITLDIAARVSRGSNMPDGTPGIQGGVVLIMPEDDVANAIMPRLMRADADLSHIVSLSRITTTDQQGHTYVRPFLLPDDIERLKTAMERVQARLVIIDPLMAVVGHRDPYRDHAARAMLAPLVTLMEERNCACLMIRHLTKSGGENILYRGGGSIAFIGLARTGLAVARHPHDEQRGVFAHIKTNIGTYAPALTFSIASDAEHNDPHPYVAWGETIDLSPRDLLAAPTANKPATLRQDILRVLKESYPQELSVQALAEALPDMTVNNIHVTLKRMVDDRQIEKAARKGFYTALLGN